LGVSGLSGLGCGGSLLGVYLRTTQRRNADGSTVRYVQLAHNVWDPVKQRSTAHVVHTFGREDRLDRDALARLAGSIGRFFVDAE
jgi:hypothetical protein